MFSVCLDSLTDMDVPLGVLIILAGLTGIHSITVSEVSVMAKGSISIPCLYLPKYTNHVKYLCKGFYWRSCTYAVRTDQKNSTKFLISDDKAKRIFTVTVNNLENADTDYWCAVEINNGPDDGNYFHLLVTTGPLSLYVDKSQENAFQGDDITINCHYQGKPRMQWCKMGHGCVTGLSGSIDETTVTINASVPEVFSVTMSRLSIQSSGWYLCVSEKFQVPVHLSVTVQSTTTGMTPTTVAEGPNSKVFGLMETLILSSVLIFTLMVALFLCFLVKRYKQNKSASPAMKEAEEEVTYSVVKPTRKPLSQRSYVEQNVDVTYSTVVSMRQQRVQKGEAKDNNATYSTLAFR